jgi:hypothetical protein
MEAQGIDIGSPLGNVRDLHDSIPGRSFPTPIRGANSQDPYLDVNDFASSVLGVCRANLQWLAVPKEREESSECVRFRSEQVRYRNTLQSAAEHA